MFDGEVEALGFAEREQDPVRMRNHASRKMDVRQGQGNRIMIPLNLRR